MLKRIALTAAVVAVFAASTAAQIEWDKKKTGEPLPNPVPITASRDEIARVVRELLDRSEIPVKSEGLEGERGVFLVATEPVVFARGVVAKTQMGHYAELRSPFGVDFSRGRVTMRIEIEPSTLTSSLVRVTATFEGLRPGMTEWTSYPSRGRLEDKLLKLLVSNITGRVFDDVQPDDPLLEIAG